MAGLYVPSGNSASSGTAGTTSGTFAAGDDSRILGALPKTDLYDVLANPAILRGTVQGGRWAGATKGATDTPTRQATLAALQAAVNSAASTNRFFELEPGSYEISGAAGLTIPAGVGFTWRGTKNSTITQFAANAPILTVGDASGTNQIYQCKVEGFGLRYGVPQTGQTNANALILSSMAWGVISNFTICDQQSNYLPLNPPNIALYVPALGAAATFFNNAVYDGNIGGAQTNLFCLAMQGTGNQFQNLYMHNGNNLNGNPAYFGALTSAAFLVANPSYATMSDNVFVRINIEAVSTGDSIIKLQEAFNTTFIGTHIEGAQLTGYGANMIYLIGGQATFIETAIQEMQTTQNACSVLNSSGAAENTTITGLQIIWSYVDNALHSSTPLVAVNANADFSPIMRVSNLKVLDKSTSTNSASLVLDTVGNVPLKSRDYGASMGEYIGDGFLPRTRKLQPIIQANYTHYGANDDAVLLVPASLSAAVTITLHSKMKPSGTGSSLPTPTGCIVRVRRQSGTYANTLTITDQAGSTTLATNSAAGADYFFRFNGTNWIAAA